MSHEKRPTVLLIEHEDSLRRMISLGLQQRGVYVVEASTPEQIPSFDTSQLDLLLFDVDSDVDSEWSFLETVKMHTQLSTLPRVVLAWEYTGYRSTSVATIEQVAYLTKPFDARALHEAVDRLLEMRNRQLAASEKQAEELLLASYAERHTANSIWPMITAIGILLMMVGMLLHVAIMALGILIAIVALLFWTLSWRPAPRRIPARV